VHHYTPIKLKKYIILYKYSHFRGDSSCHYFGSNRYSAEKENYENEQKMSQAGSAKEYSIFYSFELCVMGEKKAILYLGIKVK
jgi:hypothetical protein